MFELNNNVNFLRPYRPRLEERDPIWGDDLSYSPFIRWSPSWGFLGFSSAVRQMPGDMRSPQYNFIITLIISGRRDWCDTRNKWLLARNPDDRSWWHRHAKWKFFWPLPMAPWKTGLEWLCRLYKKKIIFSYHNYVNVQNIQDMDTYYNLYTEFNAYIFKSRYLRPFR